MRKHIAAAALAAVTASGAVAISSQAEAQDYYYYEERPHRWNRPFTPSQPYYGGGYYYQRPIVYGNICYTSRGSCRVRPAPAESPCGCFIPGFGHKRGAVVAGGW